MKAWLAILLVFLGAGSVSNANELSAVRQIQATLIQIAREPMPNNPTEARGVLDQKLSQLFSVESRIQTALQVIAHPGLRQALMSAQNILQRISRTPTNDPTWTSIYLGEVIKQASSAAAALNVREGSSSSSSCIDDVLANPLRGDTL